MFRVVGRRTRPYPITMVQHQLKVHDTPHPIFSYGATLPSYEDAVRRLNLLQSDQQRLEKLRRDRESSNETRIPRMRRYLTRAGIEDSDLARLSVIHVSGTKGKGSTCAYVESLLRHAGFRTGFYSSPHLVQVRERIRIGGKALAKEKFARYFQDVYVPLRRASEDSSLDPVDDFNMPTYFWFMTIMAIRSFLAEEVDVAIFEVGVGGEYDATNVFPSPVVCAVTTLGIDHTAILGSTISSIAWHKAGIFKPNALAFTVPQPMEAMRVLRDRAGERSASLRVVSSFFDGNDAQTPKLGIPGKPQFWNASLALHAARAWIEAKGKREGGENATGLPKEEDDADVALLEGVPIVKPFLLERHNLVGLEKTFWPGRNQLVRVRPGLTVYVDAAATKQSLLHGAHWFREETAKAALVSRENHELWRDGENRLFKVLLYNSSGGRSPYSLLPNLIPVGFDAAIFCPSTTSSSGASANSADLSSAEVDDDINRKISLENAQAWRELSGQSPCETVDSPHNPDEALSSSSSSSSSSFSSSSLAFYISSIDDALKFLDANNDDDVICDGSVVPRPTWLRRGVDVHVLATGGVRFAGAVLAVADPDLGGSLRDE